MKSYRCPQCKKVYQEDDFPLAVRIKRCFSDDEKLDEVIHQEFEVYGENLAEVEVKILDLNKERYLTRGVSNEIPLEIQILLWSMIDKLNVKKDYLQVFEIEPIDANLLKIEHRQEVPKYKSDIVVKNVGISSKKSIINAMFLSGAIGGIAGALEVMGTYGYFLDNFSSGLAFDGMLAMVLVINLTPSI